MEVFVAALELTFELEAGIELMDANHFCGGFATGVSFFSGNGIVVLVKSNRDVDGDAAQKIDGLLEALEVNGNVVVDGEAHNVT